MTAGALDPTPVASIASPTPSTAYATALSCAGDLNGDGLGDVTTSDLIPNMSAGRGYVFFGQQPVFSGVTSATIEPFLSASAQFGQSVMTVGDTDGDGLDDVFIVAPRAAAGSRRGFLYLGEASGFPNRGVVIPPGEAVSNRWGFRPAAAGDFDGDGRSDVVVGSSAGRADLYRGAATLPSSPNATLLPPDASSTGFGAVVAARAR